MNLLIRLGGYAAISGGVLKLVAAFIPYAPQSAFLEALYGVIDTGLLFGLIAVYLVAASGIGWIGLASFAVTLTALASIVGPEAEMFGIDFYQTGATVFTLGLTALSVQLIRKRILTVAASLWIASALIGVVLTSVGSPFAFTAAGVALSAGFIAAGYHILTKPYPDKNGPAGLSFNQVTIGCDDFSATSAFYRALGLTQIVDSPDKGYARLEAPNGSTLSIHHSDTAANANVLYFEHPALDEWCTLLAAQGMVFDQMPQDESWGWREARLRDPSGNIVCLYWAAEYHWFPPWRLSQ
jgi:catechol 2,3-dioxygenase-like lactoylglutathione lyase family enzyme